MAIGSFFRRLESGKSVFVKLRVQNGGVGLEQRQFEKSTAQDRGCYLSLIISQHPLSFKSYTNSSSKNNQTTISSFRVVISIDI